MTNYVRYEQDEDVAILNMDDGKANAYGPNMIAALSAGLDRANADARAIVVAGRPGVLCAGFDLKVIRGDDDAARDAMRVAGRDLLVKTYLHPQPVVFACTGHALAAGALFLMTGDYRIGAQGDFKIGLNESAIGLSLPVFGLELARDRLDPKILSDATIGARIFAPDEAVSAGYLDATVPEAVVLSAAIAKAKALAKYENSAISATKSRLRADTVGRIMNASS